MAVKKSKRKNAMEIEDERNKGIMDPEAGIDPGMPVGSKMPTAEPPVEEPGGDEGQADADQEYSDAEVA